MKETENLRLCESMTPGAEVGVWTVEVSQELSCGQTAERKIINEEKIKTSRQIIISSAVFSITEGMAVHRCPLPGLKANAADTIPHIILKDPFLPWIGGHKYKGKAVPSLGLLVVTDQELTQDSSQVSFRMKVKEYAAGKNKPAGTFRPEFSNIPQETGEQECSVLRISTALAAKVLPAKEELPYYAHCRQVYIGNKAELNLNRDGMFSVVMSPRIPQYVPGQVQPYQAFLVLLDGLLQEGGEQSKYQDFIVLDSWTFQIAGQAPHSFRRFSEDLMEKDADKMLLHLSGATADKVTEQRLQEGFVPMLFHARTGDEGLCWYRSPLTPVKGKALERKDPFFTSDAAMIYDAGNGVFDLTLAAAWEAGRLAALSDQVFVKQILNLRRMGQQITDVLFSRILSNVIENGKTDLLKNPKEFAQKAKEQLKQLSREELNDMLQGRQEAATLLSGLSQTGWDRIGEGADMAKMAGEASCTALEITTETSGLVKEFLKENYELLFPLLEEETAPLAAWLGKLMLLYPVSGDYLLPHPGLLPRESIRFFYIDENWQKAAYDGAVSLGLDSDRQADFNIMIEEILYESTKKEMLAYRASLYGETAAAEGGDPRGGFLIRSYLVSNWPTLSVNAFDNRGNSLAILRMQLLSSDTLLCILDGVPEKIQVEEPGESLQMKLLHKEYEVFRTGQHVLDLAPLKETGLLANMAKRLGRKPEEMDVLTFVTELLTTGERTIFEKEAEK